MKKSEVRQMIREEAKSLNEENKFKEALMALKNKIKSNFGKKYVCAKHITSNKWIIIPADVFFGMPITSFFFSVFDEYSDKLKDAEKLCDDLNSGKIKLEKR